jgi:hypothetical protein
MKRFRIKERDTVRARAVSVKTGKLLSTVYDSGFTTIKGVERELVRKIPHFEGKAIEVQITNLDESISKDYTIRVNQ